MGRNKQKTYFKKPKPVKVGRKKGQKTLKKVEGGYQNQYGVTFSEEQKKALIRAQNRSNYKRKKMLEAEEKRNPGASQLHLMGQEGDFIVAHQSRTLQQFKSMEEYEAYMDKQARIQSGEYLEDMTKRYKASYMKAVMNELDDPGIAMKIRMMKPEDFRKLVEEKGEDMEISYVYDPTTKVARRNKLRSLLGMKQVDEEDPYYNQE